MSHKGTEAWLESKHDAELERIYKFVEQNDDTSDAWSDREEAENDRQEHYYEKHAYEQDY